MTWQPIETAPKSGFFLVCSDYGDYYEASAAVVWWNYSKDELLCYLSDDYGFSECVYLDGPATHWMPLPEAPK